MLSHVFRNYKRALLSFFLIACVVLFSYAALAAPPLEPVDGCAAEVQALGGAIAALQKLYANAVMAEYYSHQPDSVLAMTCFNQAAGISAKKGGEIFSEDFMPEVSGVITPALKEHYKNFKTSLGYTTCKTDLGYGPCVPPAPQNTPTSTGTTSDEEKEEVPHPDQIVKYTDEATKLGDTYDCGSMQDLWDFNQLDTVKTKIPVLDVEQLLMQDTSKIPENIKKGDPGYYFYKYLTLPESQKIIMAALKARAAVPGAIADRCGSICTGSGGFQDLSACLACLGSGVPPPL